MVLKKVVKLTLLILWNETVYHMLKAKAGYCHIVQSTGTW